MDQFINISYEINKLSVLSHGPNRVQPYCVWIVYSVKNTRTHYFNIQPLYTSNNQL